MNFKEKMKSLLSKSAFEKMCVYVDLIEEYNKVMNLTGFTGDRLWEEGIYNSVATLENNGIERELLDIGAGAGFPSVPFIIANPEIKLTIVEPLQKRIKFLEIVKEKLGINITFINKRAEQIESSLTNGYITARAVAPLYALMEISHHLGSIGTNYVWIKGPKVFEELEEASKIMKKLAISCEIVEKKLDDGKINYLVKYVKNINTPKGVPRNWAQIKKK